MGLAHSPDSPPDGLSRSEAMGRAWRLSTEAEIGFLAFQVELLELSMTGPTGQIGKNNMRELNRFQYGWRSLMGVCSCLLAQEWPQVFWMGEAGLAALCFVQDIPPGDAAPVPHPAEHPWQLLHLWVQE